MLKPRVGALRGNATNVSRKRVEKKGMKPGFQSALPLSTAIGKTA